MSRLPLQTLPAFRAVARLGNLRAAADELHLTHSAVSQQMRLLEEQLGVPLFDRHGRRIALNPAGRALREAVEAALDRLAEGQRAALAHGRGEQHTLRLTVLPSFAQRWLLPRMASWRERHPGIVLDVHSSQTVVDLVRENMHAAVRSGAGHWRGLVAEPLMHSPLVAVASPARAARLAGAGAAPAKDVLEAIAAEPLIGDAEEWQAWFAQGGARLRSRPVAEFSDSGLMLQAAEQDLGVALAPEVLAADALRAGRLVRLLVLALPEPERASYWFVHRPELAEWPPLAALRAWMHEQMEKSCEGLAMPR